MAAMLSLSVNSPMHLSKTTTISSSTRTLTITSQKPNFSKARPAVEATIIPSSNRNPSSQQQLYQPFRPPPSPIPPQFRSLDSNGRIDILANRLGLWFDYAPLIPSFIQEGFSAPTIEELTGISGVEQNRLVVAAKVRESLVQSQADPQTLSFFDLGGAELLYEIRLLSTSQRLAAAQFLVEKRLDGRGAQELARALKDFPRRRSDKGWDNFSYVLPGDCLAFMYFRQALEHANDLDQKKSALEKAVEAAQSDRARERVLKELEEKDGGEGKGESVVDGVKVPVVRMKVGEVAEATSVVVLPVCRAEQKEREREVVDAPWEHSSEGDFGVVVAEKEWRRWVVLPMWEPVAGLRSGGVVVSFADARALPWRVNRWYKEEAILVVADRGRKEVAADDGFYLVARGEEGLKVERGSALKKTGVEKSLGTVVLVVRPPREETENQLADEDWE